MSASRAQRAAGAALVEGANDHVRTALARLTRHACQIASLDRACVFLRDELSAISMTAVAVHGLPDQLVGRRFRLLDGLAGHALITGKPQVVDDYRSFPRPLEGMAEGPSGAVASVPIAWGGRVRAALSAGPSEPGRTIRTPDLAVLCEVAALGALALDQAEARTALERTVEASVSALAEAVALRDPDSGKHARRVVDLAASVGRELALGSDEAAELVTAALLHDMGKLALPDGILAKAGPLTTREWELVRRHSERGAELLVTIPGLEGVAAVVLHLHEHYDGSGYPDGLRGNDIPLASRILAVCEAYDAMISDRPYRHAMRPIAALRQLERRSGRQFDPHVVTALTAAARAPRK